MTDTVDAAEVGKFSAMAERWWDADGDMAPLHAMNPVRLDYLRDQACAQHGRDPRDLRPLKGLRALDVGCGAGLLAEPLARMGAEVTAIDASAQAIEAAKAHAAAGGLEIDYRATTAEALEAEPFDLVTAMEVVEHVADRAGFARAVSAHVAADGLLVASTINRTSKSWWLAIVGAERVLRWLPQGTHDWARFPTPDELEAELTGAGLAVVDATGFAYAPVSGRWRRTDDLSVNYALTAVRG